MSDVINKSKGKHEEPIRLSSLDVLLEALPESPPAAVKPAGFLIVPLRKLFRHAKKKTKSKRSRAHRGIYFASNQHTHKGDKHE